MSVRNRCVIDAFGGVLCCHDAFVDFSVGIGAFIIWLSQISSFFSYYVLGSMNVFLFCRQHAKQATISLGDNTQKDTDYIYFPLRKSTRIPFKIFNAPLKIREDATLKRKTHKTPKKKEYREGTDPSDLLDVDGRPSENIYMLYETWRGRTGHCYQLVKYWVEGAQRESNGLSKWQKDLLVFDFLFFVSWRHIDKRITSVSSVVKMICRGKMKKYPQYQDTIQEQGKSSDIEQQPPFGDRKISNIQPQNTGGVKTNRNII